MFYLQPDEDEVDLAHYDVGQVVPGVVVVNFNVDVVLVVDVVCKDVTNKNNK